jgi:CRISPR-associated protein Csx14
MPNTFIATLGQRPEAITVALDLLREMHPIDRVVIVHTEPNKSAIASALSALRDQFSRGYDDIEQIEYYETRRANGDQMIDIIDKDTASDYFREIYGVLLRYKQQGDTLHVLIAGGRKVMSVYAALAATLIFRRGDRLWHVVSPNYMIETPGQFRIPPQMREKVHLVDMPLVPARVTIWDTPQTLLDDPLRLVAHLADLRQQLLDKLSAAERELAFTLLDHPEWTDEQLATHLNKKPRTVNNQLRAIYTKMGIVEPVMRQDGQKNRNPRMRQALLRILRGQF